MLKKLAILKYFGLGVGILNSFLQPFLFNKFFNESTFSFLLLLYGISVYLTFMDGGISKPLYSYLRAKYLKQEQLYEDLKHITSFYVLVSSLLFVLFFIAISVVWCNYVNSLNFLFLILFTIYTVLNVVISYHYNILSAVDEYFFFEQVNVVRRLLNFVSVLLLFVDKSFVLSFVLCDIVLVVLYIKILKRLAKKYCIPLRSMITINKESIFFVFNRFYADSKNYVIFSINETLIYNSGFLLIPYFLSSFYVVQYGLYVRIYAGIATFMRSVIDITIHDITRLYNNSELLLLKRRILLTTAISVLIVTLGIITFLLLQKFIFTHWVDEKYLFNTSIIIALAFWLFGNSIQHVSGTFLVSIGGNFNKIKKISFYVLVPMLIIQCISLYIWPVFSVFIFLSSIVYFIGSVYYYYTMFKQIKYEQYNYC